MSVNRELPHVLVLPEDDADRQLANGFHLETDWMFQRQMQVLPEAGGWREVVNLFTAEHISGMDRYLTRFMILLIDFDDHLERFEEVHQAVPARLRGRVFILGSLSEPEDLKRAALGSYEEIGASMAQDCRQGTNETWSHDLLRHNYEEVERLRISVRPILFG